MFLRPINLSEIIIEIGNLKSNSAPGSDGITSKDLKLISSIIAPHLVRIFNDNLSHGEFPEVLKLSTIKPIFKAGIRDDTNNYRPISLLSTIGKLFEKLINSRLTSFINKFVKMDPNQFGFQKNSGTESALIQTVNYINTKLDEGNYVLAVFIDLKKAFDLVNHEILLQSLEEIGVRGTAHCLFKNYLTNRKVKMKIGTTESSSLISKTGVPQGSVLGPTLYLIYILNMQRCGLLAKYTIYADDTSLIYSAKNKEDLEQKTNEDLEKFANWTKGNRLQINVGKTVYLLFKQKNKQEISLDVRINGNSINRLTCTKYLGVIIDEKMSWSHHIDELNKKLNPLIGAFRRCSKLPPETAKNVYEAFVTSRISSILTIWSNGNKNIKRRAYSLMTRAIRCLYKLNWRIKKEELHSITRTKSLESLINISSCKLIYKIQHGLIKNNINITERNEINPYPIRTSHNITMITSRTQQLSNGVLNSAIKIYNSLPQNIKKEKNLKKFCTNLKLYF